MKHEPADILAAIPAESLLSDLLGQSLYRSGRELVYICPWSNKPKLYVNSVTGLWDSKSGHKSGNLFGLVCEVRGIQFRDALRYLCDQAGIPFSDDPKQEQEWRKYQERKTTLEMAWEFFASQLWQPESADVVDYLRDRGYSDDTISRMPVGSYTSAQKLQAHLAQGFVSEDQLRNAALITDTRYGSSHRLVLPWRDAGGRHQGFILRTTSNAEPKYLFTFGTSKSTTLANAEVARGRKHVLVVEGVFDAYHLSAHGIPALAIGSDKISAQQIRSLSDCGVRSVSLCMDSDNAGRDGARRNAPMIAAAGMTCHIASLPSSIKDPDQYCVEEGPEACLSLMKAESWGAWLGRDLTIGVDLSDSQPRDNMLRECRVHYARIMQTSAMVADDFKKSVMRVCAASGLPAESVRLTIEGSKNTLDQTMRLQGHVGTISAGINRQVDDALAMLDDPSSAKRNEGMSLGLNDKLDQALLGGVLRQDCGNVSARTGGGKTRILASSLVGLAMRGIPVGLVSLDMRANRLHPYIASSIAAANGDDNISPRDMLYPENTQIGRARLTDIGRYADQVQDSFFAVTDGDKNIAAMEVYGNELVQLGCRLIVFDGLYSLDEWAGGTESQGKLYSVVGWHKKFAERNDVGVITVGQVTKAGYEYPQLRDVHFGSPIIQLCDWVLLIHDQQAAMCASPDTRGFIWNNQTGECEPPKKGHPATDTQPRIQRNVELILAKNRGETGKYDCEFDFRRGIPAHATRPAQVIDYYSGEAVR